MLKWVLVLFSTLHSPFAGLHILQCQLTWSFEHAFVLHHSRSLSVAFSMAMVTAMSSAEGYKCRNMHYRVEWHLIPAKSRSYSHRYQPLK